MVTGYHGTSLEAAERIVASDFLASINDWEWLGHGVYFWQDGPMRAREWAKTWLRRRHNYHGAVAVIAADIQLRDFIDLLDQEHMLLLGDIAASFDSRMLTIGTSYTNKPPLNRHDCALFNFTTNLLDSRGLKIRGYRAACRSRRGLRSTTGLTSSCP